MHAEQVVDCFPQLFAVNYPRGRHWYILLLCVVSQGSMLWWSQAVT